jgi:hypothetical protein
VARHAATLGRPSFGGILELCVVLAESLFVVASPAAPRATRIAASSAPQKKERRQPDAKS